MQVCRQVVTAVASVLAQPLRRVLMQVEKHLEV
jgi:hypothetical protein